MRHRQTDLLLCGVLGIHNAGDLAGADDQDPIAEFEKNIQILADENNGSPQSFLFIQQIVDREGGIDVKPSHGIRRHQHRRCRRNLTADQDLLYITAGQTAHGRLRVRGHNLKIMDDRLRKPAGVISVQENARALAVAPEHHIVDDVHVADKPHAETILRDKRQTHAEGTDLHRVLADQVLDGVGLRIVIENTALGHLLQSGDRLEKLPLAAPRNTRDAEYLAAARHEIDILEHRIPFAVHDTQIDHFQPVDRVSDLASLDIQTDLLADHHLRQFRDAGLRCLNGADIPALAEHGNLLGERHNLIQLVRDDNDGFAVVAHTPKDREQLLGLLRSQHSRRLVKDQNIRTAVQNLDDLDRLLLRHGHVVNLLVRVKFETVAHADLTHALRVRFDVVAALILETEDDIFRRGKYIHQFEMLVDHADPMGKCIARRADGNPLAVHVDPSAVRIVNSGDHVHERRLAAAVLTENGEDLASLHAEAHVVVGDHLAERLGDADELDRRSVGLVHMLTEFCSSDCCFDQVSRLLRFCTVVFVHRLPPETTSAGHYGPAEKLGSMRSRRTVYVFSKERRSPANPLATHQSP